ncbi:aminotransferase class I/II-fold pyridoxal phosphate-dependent enzyme [Fructobacillus ficulneus]|uniref:Cysteine gamma synthase/O-succinylhomoserine(Thiol)-lyase n=1 Tax=Fructobacillus ficulneus TaxID=157463 RepID=A0A0K8MGX0_9LACO|nr:aminotransferase class I/II-fold pyridoxal phosphate-dependent enzyme [Fructobacillus ficulneus]GAO99806.1 cysteine gamma synthase/O-succinylhomoserine(Thiol)-lyase [Fructobacillus ficulneus]
MASECSWQRKIETILAQAGNRVDQVTGSISMPLYFSTAYRHEGLGQSTGYDYSRMTEPTRAVLEDVLAQMENGVKAFAVSSGMAAIQLAFSQFKSGDHIIISDDLYGGSFRYFDLLADQYHLRFSKWDGQDYDALDALLADDGQAVWLETPSNPTMKVIDIEKTADHAHQYDAQVLVDNTFYTPLIQQPLNLGADIVVHSATKYLSGHNDILAGVVICKTEETAEVLGKNLITTGPNLGPFDSWLLLRSLKTLPLRLARQEENAQRLVAELTKSPAIEKVLYPGRGGMISVYVQDDVSVDLFLQHLEVISFAESLGGTESLVTVPAVQTHADMSEEERAKTGITANLLRISCGIEDASDLIRDLNQALAAASQPTKELIHD